MELIGYARTNSTDQDSIIQIEVLKAAGCSILFIEKKCEKTFQEQNAFKECMTYLRKGDMLMVTRVERLVDSLFDLQNLLINLDEKQVGFKAIEQPIDTSDLNNKAFTDLLDIFVKFETNVRRERQLGAMARAKNNGICRGRKPSIDYVKVHHLRFDEQLGASEIARKLGIGRSSVYKVLARKCSRM